MSEYSVIMGAEDHLVATLTPATPTGPSPARVAAVLTNSGVIPRSGPHRMNVHLANRFAAMGIPSIRFDLSGLGDSRRFGGTLPGDEQWVADTRAAMDLAQSRFGCERFFMVGFCSGAEVAQSLALTDPRLRAITLWDAYSFPTIQSRLRTWVLRARRVGLLTALQRGLSRMLPTLAAVTKRAVQAREAEAEVSDAPPRHTYANRIQTLVDDGVKLLFLYSAGQPLEFNHRGQFRAMFRRYGFVDKVDFHYLDMSDHLLTQRRAKEQFTNLVVQWLEQRVLTAESGQEVFTSQGRGISHPEPAF